MDHRISKDMISQGMSVKGEKTTEELNNTQLGKVATPHNMLDAYQSMYSEDAKWGYDPKGNSLNPADKKKKKVKEDVEQLDEIVPVVAGLAAKAIGGLAAKTAAAGGIKAVAGKVAGSAVKQAVADKAISTIAGGKKKEPVEGVETNPDDLIQELVDSGLFSEEELKSITEISSNKLLDAAKASEVARGKKAVAGDKEGAKKEVARSSKFFNAAQDKAKKH